MTTSMNVGSAARFFVSARLRGVCAAGTSDLDSTRRGRLAAPPAAGAASFWSRQLQYFSVRGFTPTSAQNSLHVRPLSFQRSTRFAQTSRFSRPRLIGSSGTPRSSHVCGPYVRNAVGRTDTDLAAMTAQTSGRCAVHRTVRNPSPLKRAQRSAQAVRHSKPPETLRFTHLSVALFRVSRNFVMGSSTGCPIARR